MERKIYQKETGDSLSRPRTWKTFSVPKTELHPNEISVLLVDSNGHIGSLDDHTIAENGEVMPSVVCGHKGCDFHEWITLDGWAR